jgi:hypothetical protein
MKILTDYELSKIADNWTKEIPDNIGIKTAFAAGFRLAEQIVKNSLPDSEEIDTVINERTKNCISRYTEKEIRLGKQAFRNGCSFVINRFLNGIS